MTHIETKSRANPYQSANAKRDIIAAVLTLSSGEEVIAKSANTAMIIENAMQGSSRHSHFFFIITSFPYTLRIATSQLCWVGTPLC